MSKRLFKEGDKHNLVQAYHSFVMHSSRGIGSLGRSELITHRDNKKAPGNLFERAEENLSRTLPQVLLILAYKPCWYQGRYRGRKLSAL